MDEIEKGDEVKVIKGKNSHQGIVMPHHRFSKDNILTLKLESGYNIGIEIDDDCEIKLIQKAEKKSLEKKRKTELEIDKNKPKISILGTGGTIASYVEYKTGAVHPAQDENDVLYSNPKIADRCNPDVEILFSKLSEDISPKDWIKLADKVIKKLEDEEAEGVVISHGTDTLGYTSAALSFLLEGLSKPVVLVGSQRSSDRPSSDAYLNLLGAIEMAKSGIGGVFVVMHETISDKKCAVHKGTKVRKMHTSRRDAFKSINTDPIGYINPKTKKVNIENRPKQKKKKSLRRRGNMVENVSLLYVNPSIDESTLESVKDKDGIVIAGTGLGHIKSDLIPHIQELIQDGIPIVITSQCIYGTVNNHVYSSGRKLLEAGVLSGHDMLPETALVKLMWALSLEEDTEKIMRKNIAGEINDRREV